MRLVQQVVRSDLSSYDIDSFITNPLSLMWKRLIEEVQVISHCVRVTKPQICESTLSINDSNGEVGLSPSRLQTITYDGGEHLHQSRVHLYCQCVLVCSRASVLLSSPALSPLLDRELALHQVANAAGYDVSGQHLAKVNNTSGLQGLPQRDSIETSRLTIRFSKKVKKIFIDKTK